MRFLFSGTLATLLVVGIDALSSSDFFVRKLPGQPEGSHAKMHAGHITVDEQNDGALFFWHFANKHIADRPRTIIWLNGGPGCSSEDGALMEIGPFHVRGENLIENEGSWNEFANLLFVDQPVGTGFSYVNTNAYLHELPEMAAQFLVFLKKWIELFPEYRDDDLYIAGESYAGQHIPYIADAIVKYNAEQGHPFNLQGLLIGNGWTDPVNQYPAYASYAYEMGLVKEGSEAAQPIENQLAVCRAALKEGVHVSVEKCEDVLNTILRVTRDEHDPENSCINMYDIRLRDSYPSCGMSWPPDLKDVTPYLRRPDVVKALNVDTNKKKSGWTECAGSVSSSFRARNSVPAVSLLPSLLENMPILLYSGDQDLICNHLGTEDMIHKMTWLNGTGFEDPPGSGEWAPRQPWNFDGELAGFYQTARNLTYVLFYNSSHMVPFDYPRRTRDMLDRFVGVDIRDIGGEDGASRVGGETNRPPTSVDETTKQSEESEEKEKEKLKQATWRAYYKAGAAALVFVIIAALALGFFVYRQRRKQGARGPWDVVLGKLGSRQNRAVRLEEGLDDENELDELVVDTPMFSISDDEETDDESGGKRRRSEVETARFVNGESKRTDLDD